MLALTHSLATSVAVPITGPWPQAFPAKDLCSNCGLCRSTVGVASVTEACAFIGDGMSRAESLEAQVHGRGRQYDEDDLDEAHFGVHDEILLARGFLNNAQWTGVATGVALAWLESGAVDAVVVAGSEDEGGGFGAPKPVLCKTPAEVLRGRRVKPSLCPSLEVLDEVKADASIERLLFCGVGCAVQALRALGGARPEAALGLQARRHHPTPPPPHPPHTATTPTDRPPFTTATATTATSTSQLPHCHRRHRRLRCVAGGRAVRARHALRRQQPNAAGGAQLRLDVARSGRGACRRRPRVRVHGGLPGAREVSCGPPARPRALAPPPRLHPHALLPAPPHLASPPPHHHECVLYCTYTPGCARRRRHRSRRRRRRRCQRASSSRRT